MRNHPGLQPASGVVSYCGPDGEKYEDKFQIDIKNYMTIFSVADKEEDLIKRFTEQYAIQKETNQILWQIAQKRSDLPNGTDGGDVVI